MAVSLTTGERPFLPPFFSSPNPAHLRLDIFFSPLSLSFHVFLSSACEDCVTAFPAARIANGWKGANTRQLVTQTQPEANVHTTERSLDRTVKTPLSLGCVTYWCHQLWTKLPKKSDEVCDAVGEQLWDFYVVSFWLFSITYLVIITWYNFCKPVALYKERWEIVLWCSSLQKK